MEIDQNKVLAVAEVLGVSEKEVLDALTDDDSTKIATLKQAEEAYRSAPLGSKAERLAVEKWNDLFRQRVKQIEKLLTFVTSKQAEDIYYSAPGGSEAERLAMERWNDLSRQEVERATTLEQASVAYSSAPIGSEAERMAIRKLYELIS